MKHILMVCGAGMSSGFLAQSCRKAAKKKGIEVQIDARSESEVSQFAGKIDVLLVGPHYKAEIPQFQKTLGDNTPIAAIPKEIYSSLDGEKLLKFAFELIDGEQK